MTQMSTSCKTEKLNCEVIIQWNSTEQWAKTNPTATCINTDKSQKQAGPQRIHTV